MVWRFALILAMAMAMVPPVVAQTTAPAAWPTATSTDGRWRASVRPASGPEGASGAAASALWLTDLDTGQSRLLYRGHESDEPKRNTTSLDAPHFSLDGGYIYVEADAYATSPAIHQIDRRTGRERYVVDGALLGVLRNGPWRGYLVVRQHRYLAGGGSYDPVLVYRPNGQEIATIPGSAAGRGAVRAWLGAKGWRISQAVGIDTYHPAPVRRG